jgi:hypothetical protein
MKALENRRRDLWFEVNRDIAKEDQVKANSAR